MRRHKAWIAALAAFAGLHALPPLNAESGKLGFSLVGEAGILGGATISESRPMLPREGEFYGISAELVTPRLIPLSIGVRWIKILPSLPDATYFLYRGYEGGSVLLETGLRLTPESDIWAALFGAGSAFELRGGAGLMVASDIGSTLVALEPFARLSPGLSMPIKGHWSLNLALPLQYHLRGIDHSFLVGLTTTVSWNSLKVEQR